MKMHKQYMGKAHINNMERVLDGSEEMWVLSLEQQETAG